MKNTIINCSCGERFESPSDTLLEVYVCPKCNTGWEMTELQFVLDTSNKLHPVSYKPKTNQ
jgi:Zn-finger nucleic acid-binding protein